ncbi:MAG: hypothetical protein AAF674_19165 [Pseudomonadota bacterium]
MLRDDEQLRKASEIIVGQFKYHAGLCWAPVIVVLAFFRGEDSEFGLYGKLLVSGAMAALMVAGAIFFLAYQKQSMMLAHALMGDEALERASQTNPSALRQIEQTYYVAWRLGPIADRVAFPLMTSAYVAMAVAAFLAVWI